MANVDAGFAEKPDGLPQRKLGMAVSGNFFGAMGVEPEMGRGFRPEEDQVPGRDAVVVLDHSLWEQQFASRPEPAFHRKAAVVAGFQRLRIRGVTTAEAQAELNTFARNLERTYPATNKNQNMVARTELRTRIDSDPIDAALSAMLMTLSMALLLTACINVASLLTSRAPARAKEMALRLAIGAG